MLKSWWVPCVAISNTFMRPTESCLQRPHQKNHHIPDYKCRITSFGPFRLQHTATFEESLDSLFAKTPSNVVAVQVPVLATCMLIGLGLMPGPVQLVNDVCNHK